MIEAYTITDNLIMKQMVDQETVFDTASINQ